MRANERANLIASHVARRAKVNPRTYLSSQHHSYERGGIKINDSDAAMRYSSTLSVIRVSEFTSERPVGYARPPDKSHPKVSKSTRRIDSSALDPDRAESAGGEGRRGGGVRRGTDGVPTKRETKCFRQKWANGAHSIGFEAVRYVTRMSAIIYVVLLVG